MASFCPTLAFIDNLGGSETMVIFVIVLLLFGGKKLPEFARGMGKSIREFKKAAAGVEEEFKRALDEDERRSIASERALTAAPASPSLPAPAVTDAAATPATTTEEIAADAPAPPVASLPASDPAVPPAAPLAPADSPPPPDSPANPKP